MSEAPETQGGSCVAPECPRVNNARALGFRVNNRPTVGSVMVRDSGTWGHVAVVARVDKHRFLVQEYNHNVDHGYGQRWIARGPNGDRDHLIHFRR
jgi:surface antigen